MSDDRAMKKSQAIKRLGGTNAMAARNLGISRQAVHKWPDPLSKGVERRVRAKLDDLAQQSTTASQPGRKQA